GDRMPVRRPLRITNDVIVFDDLFSLLRVDIDGPQMSEAEILVDNFGVVFLFLFLLLLRRQILQSDISDCLAIRRPLKRLDSGFRIGKFFGFATCRRNQKYLRFVFTSRYKRNPFTVRRPPRLIIILLIRRQPYWLTA